MSEIKSRRARGAVQAAGAEERRRPGGGGRVVQHGEVTMEINRCSGAPPNGCTALAPGPCGPAEASEIESRSRLLNRRSSDWRKAHLLVLADNLADADSEVDVARSRIQSTVDDFQAAVLRRNGIQRQLEKAFRESSEWRR
jgi:hypothetical protein